MVKVLVTVVKRTMSQATVELEVDDNEDQWSTFEKARQVADTQQEWTDIDVYTDRFHSSVLVLEPRPEGWDKVEGGGSYSDIARDGMTE